MSQVGYKEKQPVLEERAMKNSGLSVLWSILYALFGGLVFILGLNLLHWIPEKMQDVYKIALPVLFLVLIFVSQKYFPAQKNVMWAFFLVSLAWVLDFYLTGKIAALFSLNTKTLPGMAYTMLISALLISATVIIGWLASRHEFSTIFLQGSDKKWGILVGVLGLILFGGLGFLQAHFQGMAFKAMLAAVPLALVFSLANAFREELVYRAIFLEGFRDNIGTIAAILVTSVVFVLAHVEVSYDTLNLIIFTVVLILISIVGSLIMLKTGSILGAVLFHAGADVVLILGLLASKQMTIL